MEIVLEKLITYGLLLLLCGIVVYLYLRTVRRRTKTTEAKIEKAKEAGLHEPVSLHPVVDLDTCIGSGACEAACPEKALGAQTLGLVTDRLRSCFSCLISAAVNIVSFCNCCADTIMLL